MQMIPGYEWIYALIFGAMVGSFLNVVILRYPPRMMWGWKQEAREFLDLPTPPEDIIPPAGLVVERSHCPSCHTPISWYDNVPLLGFALLRGKCRACGERISWQYPAVEAAMALLALGAVATWGWSVQGLVGAAFFAVLLVLTGIDLKTRLLPDQIVLPAVWGALLASMLPGSPIAPEAAMMGAMIGYMSLWSVFWLFKIATGKEGMGYGDFKLLALIGAMLGPSSILPVVLCSTVAGSVVGIALMARRKESQPFAFGPYLALGGVVYALAQEQIHALIPLP